MGEGEDLLSFLERTRLPAQDSKIDAVVDDDGKGKQNIEQHPLRLRFWRPQVRLETEKDGCLFMTAVEASINKVRFLVGAGGGTDVLKVSLRQVLFLISATVLNCFSYCY